MKLAAKEILNNKNLDSNIPALGNGLMHTFNSYSYVRLAMNYYVFYEMVNESSNVDEKLKNYANRLNQIIGSGVISPVMGEEQVALTKQIDKLRKDVTKDMEGLTSLADIFNIYEYVLNRIEYNYKDASHISLQTDEEFANEILAYILSDKDNVVMNTRICEMVGELPLRITKAKFFEMLKTGLMVYKESEKQSVNDYIYMLSTAAMLLVSENAISINDDVASIYNEFEQTDFSNLDEDAFNNLSAKLKYVTDFINDSVNKFMLLAEVINDAYVILLSNHYVMDMPTEHESCMTIIKMLHDGFENDSFDTEDIEQYFYNLEGRQEEYYRQYQSVLGALDAIRDNYMNEVNSFSLDAMFESLAIIEKLESGSTFIELDKVSDNELADALYIESKFEEIKDKYVEFFDKHKKQVNRAIMARTLSALPIFFGNMDDIKEYVLSSLSKCTDKAEKLACYEIFHSLMEE